MRSVPEGRPGANASARRTSTVGALVMALAMGVGVAAGIGGYTFVYARGYSYLLDDSSACGNCHIMSEQLGGWVKGSHRSVASCNDCHTPHDVLGKYLAKANNGFHHSWAFTRGRFVEPIQIGERNRAVTEAACRDCHASVVAAIEPSIGHRGEVSCLQCHRDVGHLH